MPPEDDFLLNPNAPVSSPESSNSDDTNSTNATNDTNDTQEPDELLDSEENSDENPDTGEGDDEEVLVAPEDAVDLEIEGETYVIPKKLQDAFMRQKDYTEKTTALSQQRQAYEAQQETFGERVQMQEALLNDITEIKSVDMRLAEYANVDWQAASQRNPQAAQQAWFEYQQLKDFRSSKVQEIDAKIEKRRSDNAAQEAKLVQETVTALKAPDSALAWPGHSPEHMTKVASFAKGTLGIPPDDLKRIKSPIAVKTLNLARIGYEYLQSMKARTKTPAIVPEPVKQVPTNKSQASFDPMKLPMDKWVIHERKRMAKKRAELNGQNPRP